MSAKQKSGSGVPPLSQDKKQSRDGSATLAAPTGRKKLAQGKERSDAALGHESQNTSSPEAANEGGMVALGEMSESRVAQDGPPSCGEFTYVDISSIDRETKRIVDPKSLPVVKAPSRARQALKAGDVLVSMTRPNLNAVALVPPDLDGAIGSTGFHVLRAKDAEPGFLFYAVQTTGFIDAMCLKVQGALYPAVRPKDISSFCIAPFSLPEQRRIVAGVAVLRRVQANLKRYRAAVLKAACEGKLVPTEAELTTKSAKSTKTKPASLSASSAISAVKTPGFETGEQLLKRILAERRQHCMVAAASRRSAPGKQKSGSGVPPLNQEEQSRDGSATLSATFKYKEPAAPDTANLPPLARWLDVGDD